MRHERALAAEAAAEGCLGLPTGDDWTLRTPISNPLIVDLCATDTQFSTPKVAQRSLDGRGEGGFPELAVFYGGDGLEAAIDLD